MTRGLHGGWIAVGAFVLVLPILPPFAPHVHADASSGALTAPHRAVGEDERSGIRVRGHVPGRAVMSDMVRTSRVARAKPIRSPRNLTLNFALFVPDGERKRGVSSAERAEVRQAVATVDEYYNGLSGGLLRVKLGRIVGWTTSQACDYSLLDSGAFSGLTRKPGNHLVMVKACPRAQDLAGLGDMPGRNIWLNGLDRGDSAGGLTGVDAATLAHELGHNLGARHAKTESCLTLFFKMTCKGKDLRDRMVDEYGDAFDLMGGGGGPMNPILSARIGLPYRTVLVNPKTLKEPVSVTLLPRTSSPTGVRALRLRVSGTDVHISLAAGGVWDRYGSESSGDDARSAPTLLAHADMLDGTVLLKVNPSATGSGLAEGLSFRVSDGVIMHVDEVSKARAVLTFTLASPGAVSGTLEATSRGLVARWKSDGNAGPTGYRLKLLGESPCSDDFWWSECLDGTHMKTPLAAEVDVDAGVTEYVFTGLNAGQSYALQVVPLLGTSEGVGLLSAPVRNLVRLPEVSVSGTSARVTISSDAKDVAVAFAEFEFDCPRFRYSGYTGYSYPGPQFPLIIDVPRGCAPGSGRLIIKGGYEDGTMFELPLASVKWR